MITKGFSTPPAPRLDQAVQVARALVTPRQWLAGAMTRCRCVVHVHGGYRRRAYGVQALAARHQPSAPLSPLTHR